MLALAALEHYELKVERLSVVSWHLNVLYRVETTTGERFALRISQPTWRDDTERRSEVAWLAALADDPEIDSHVPLPNRTGELITTVATDVVPAPGQVILFSWAPGVPLAKKLTEPNVEQMGRVAARLHDHGARFQPPPGFTTRRLDRLFPRDEQVVLFAAEHLPLYTAEQRSVFEMAIDRAQAELDRLYRNSVPPHVIHGDLHHENVLIHQGRLHVVDFEDVINAYPIQDIALTFYDFRYYTDPARHDYASLCAAFQRGYTQLREWPQEYERQIDILHVARRNWVSNWVLQIEDAVHHAPFIEREAGRLQRLMGD